MQHLSQKTCSADASALSTEQIEQHLQQVNQWQLSEDKKWLKKSFQFNDFYHTMAFVNALAFFANQENHHPDLEIGYNYCHICLQTHTVKGLSENDFICASKIDTLGADK